MPTPRNLDVMSALLREGAKAELQLKTPEDPEERRHRLRKDFYSFLIKDLMPYALAAFFALAIGIYGLRVLLTASSPPEDKERAWTALTTILAGVIGVLFGRATTKE